MFDTIRTVQPYERDDRICTVSIEFIRSSVERGQSVSFIATQLNVDPLAVEFAFDRGNDDIRIYFDRSFLSLLVCYGEFTELAKYWIGQGRKETGTEVVGVDDYLRIVFLFPHACRVGRARDEQYIQKCLRILTEGGEEFPEADELKPEEIIDFARAFLATLEIDSREFDENETLECLDEISAGIRAKWAAEIL